MPQPKTTSAPQSFRKYAMGSALVLAAETDRHEIVGILLSAMRNETGLKSTYFHMASMRAFEKGHWRSAQQLLPYRGETGLLIDCVRLALQNGHEDLVDKLREHFNKDFDSPYDLPWVTTPLLQDLFKQPSASLTRRFVTTHPCIAERTRSSDVVYWAARKGGPEQLQLTLDTVVKTRLDLAIAALAGAVFRSHEAVVQILEHMGSHHTESAKPLCGPSAFLSALEMMLCQNDGRTRASGIESSIMKNKLLRNQDTVEILIEAEDCDGPLNIHWLLNPVSSRPKANPDRSGPWESVLTRVSRKRPGLLTFLLSQKYTPLPIREALEEYSDVNLQILSDFGWNVNEPVTHTMRQDNPLRYASRTYACRPLVDQRWLTRRTQCRTLRLSSHPYSPESWCRSELDQRSRRHEVGREDRDARDAEAPRVIWRRYSSRRPASRSSTSQK